MDGSPVLCLFIRVTHRVFSLNIDDGRGAVDRTPPARSAGFVGQKFTVQTDVLDFNPGPAGGQRAQKARFARSHEHRGFDVE